MEKIEELHEEIKQINEEKKRVGDGIGEYKEIIAGIQTEIDQLKQYACSLIVIVGSRIKRI